MSDQPYQARTQPGPAGCPVNQTAIRQPEIEEQRQRLSNAVQQNYGLVQELALKTESVRVIPPATDKVSPPQPRPMLRTGLGGELAERCEQLENTNQLLSVLLASIEL